MTTMGRLLTENLLTVTISRPLGYSCGDHDLTRGTNGLTYSMRSLVSQLKPTSAPTIVLSLSTVILHLCYYFTLRLLPSTQFPFST